MSCDGDPAVRLGCLMHRGPELSRDSVPQPSNSQINRAADLMREWRAARAEERARPAVEAVFAAIETIGQFRAEFAAPLTKVVMGLRSFVKTEGVDPTGRVAQRLKRMPTILDKLEREPGMNLARMHDIGGCRAILPDEATIYRVIRRIRSQPRERWGIVREYDYIKRPKASGYRGVHLVVRRDGRLIEIQLRTPTQHRWALSVEAIDLARRLGLKEGKGPEALRRLLEVSAYAMEATSQGETMSEEFDRDFERLRRAASRELR